MIQSIPQLHAQFEAFRQANPLTGNPVSLYEPMEYILSLGGKRLRPVLCMAACQAFGQDAELSLSPALGLEVFHNFSLVHDDIMDEAPIRRGKSTVHKQWDLNTAILSGDAMLVEAYRLMANCPSSALPNVLRSFNDMAKRLCEGQRLDIDFETRTAVGEAEYLEMIEGKTSVLIGCAMEIGALIGGATQEEASHMYAFGLQLGLAFQIRDDYLDCFGDSAKTGKQEGGDILAGKHTLLAIQASSQNVEAFSEAMKLNGEKRVEEVKKVFQQTGADRYALDKSEHLLQDSLSALKLALPASPERDELEAMAISLVHRDH